MYTNKAIVIPSIPPRTTSLKLCPSESTIFSLGNFFFKTFAFSPVAYLTPYESRITMEEIMNNIITGVLTPSIKNKYAVEETIAVVCDDGIPPDSNKNDLSENFLSNNNFISCAANQPIKKTINNFIILSS